MSIFKKNNTVETQVRTRVEPQKDIVQDFFRQVLERGVQLKMTPGTLLVLGDGPTQVATQRLRAAAPRTSAKPEDYGLHVRQLSISYREYGLAEQIMQKLQESVMYSNYGEQRFHPSDFYITVGSGIEVSMYSHPAMEVYSIIVEPHAITRDGRKVNVPRTGRKDPLYIEVYGAPEANQYFTRGCMIMALALRENPNLLHALQQFLTGGNAKFNLQKPRDRFLLHAIGEGAREMIRGIDFLFAAAAKGKISPFILHYAVSCVQSCLFSIENSGAVPIPHRSMQQLYAVLRAL